MSRHPPAVEQHDNHMKHRKRTLRAASTLALTALSTILTVLAPAPVTAQTDAHALIVMTSRDYMLSRDRRTGVRLAEVVQAWDVFHQAGLHVDFASGRGGRPPVDTAGAAVTDSAAQRFLADTAALRGFTEAQSIALVNPELYDIVLFAGGHGALWEFLEDPQFANVARAVHARGGIIATVGHGAAVLLTTTTSSGASILGRARITCTSDEEEVLDGFENDLPYYLETAARRSGAIHFRDAPHAVNVVAEDRLITGQNSESARETASSAVLKLRILRGLEGGQIDAK